MSSSSNAKLSYSDVVFAVAAPQQAQRGLIGGSESVDRTSLRVVCRMYRVERIAQCPDGSVKRIARFTKRAARLVVSIEDRIDLVHVPISHGVEQPGMLPC